MPPYAKFKYFSRKRVSICKGGCTNAPSIVTTLLCREAGRKSQNAVGGGGDQRCATRWRAMIRLGYKNQSYRRKGGGGGSLFLHFFRIRAFHGSDNHLFVLLLRAGSCQGDPARPVTFESLLTRPTRPDSTREISIISWPGPTRPMVFLNAS